MAIEPKDVYPGQVDETNPVAYPSGAAQDDAVEGDGTGTPLEKLWVTDLFGFQQALLLAAGLTATGVPDTAIASQYLDAVLAVGGARRAVQEWTREDLPVTAASADILLTAVVGVQLSASVKSHAIYAVGYDLNDSNFTKFFRGYAGRFEDNANAPAFALGPLAVSAGAPGELLWAAPGSSVKRCVSLGATVDSTACAAQAVHYAPGATNKYIFALSDGSFQVGATFGSVANVAGPAGITDIEAAALGAPKGRFVDDGGNNVVYCGKCTISGVTALRLLSSTNGGATWTSAQTFAAGALWVNVVWQKATGQFVCMYEFAAGQTGVAVSPTGAAWTPVVASTVLTWPAGALASGAETFACVGRCIAKIIGPGYFSKTVGGIAYSFDLGATWRFVFLDQEFVPTAIAGIDGRFYVVHHGSQIFRSGVIEYADADL